MTGGPGRVVYAGFATPRPSGGVHVMVQHVGLLRAAGIDARLWLPGPGATPDWLVDGVTPLLAGAHLDLAAADVLVVPEVPVRPERDPAPGANVVLLNQNHFYTYAAGAWPVEASYPGWPRDPLVWAVSREAVDVLTGLHPHLQVRLVPNHVDDALFSPAGTAAPSVVWLPRKRPRESTLLHRLLAGDPRLADVELVPLQDRPRAEVAAALGRATVFVALSHSEGFGLPVLEALAAGCLVVGYDGGGGHELFEAPGTWAVPAQRPLLLRDRVVDLVARRAELAPLARANRDWALRHHPRPTTRTALLEGVAEARCRPGAATRATHPAAWLDALGPHFTAFA